MSIAVDKNPSDTVSDLKFILNKDKLYLGASSWDGSVRVYEVDQNLKSKTIMEYNENKVAFLRFCFNQQDPKFCYAAGSNLEIIQLEIKEKPTKTVIGNLEDRVVGLGWIDSSNQLVSCSADKVVKVWDVKAKKEVKTVKLISKPTYMSCDGKYAMVADVGSDRLHVIDLKEMTPKPTPVKPPHIEKSGLITGISIRQDGDGFKFIAGTTYGMCAIGANGNCKVLHGHINKMSSSSCASNFVDLDKGNIGVSAGSDGKIALFDLGTGDNLDKDMDLSKGKGTSITAIALSPVPNVRFVAFALGNDWSKGAGGKNDLPSIAIVKLN